MTVQLGDQYTEILPAETVISSVGGPEHWRKIFMNNMEEGIASRK
jgi:hypothetical protein